VKWCGALLCFKKALYVCMYDDDFFQPGMTTEGRKKINNRALCVFKFNKSCLLWGSNCGGVD
jgi:hypothetical protein